MIFNPAIEQLATAREKIVFRPVLPGGFLSGITEMQMAKMTYSEQLKHPLWQRKRLEVLNAANFQCGCCGDKEKTLHVHHKQYVKGRLPWEYEASDLEVLCVDCHEAAHVSKARIDAVIAQFPSLMWDRITLMLIGYGEEYVDQAMWEFVTEDFARAGQVAWFMGNYEPAEACEFRALCEQLGPDGVISALRSAALIDC